MRFYFELMSNMFAKYTDDRDQRIAFTDFYHFTDTYQNLIEDVQALKGESRFQTICEGAYPSFKGSNHCAYNMAMSLLQAKEFLTANLSSDPSKWYWSSYHGRDYMFLPWSLTSLKFLFH